MRQTLYKRLVGEYPNGIYNNNSICKYINHGQIIHTYIKYPYVEGERLVYTILKPHIISKIIL